MRKFGLSSLAIVSLLVSVLTPAATATSAGTNVTKTFSITKADGSPYSGVVVALLEYDEGFNETVLSPTATTNSSGVATLQVPADKDYYAWSAQPGGGDVTHALTTEYEITNGENETLSAQLSLANMVVDVLQSTGTAAALGSSIAYISSQNSSDLSYKTIIRTGPFGIDISPELQSSTNYEINIEPNAMPTQFGGQFGLRVDAAANPITRTVFADTTYTTQVAPLSGVYSLRFAGPNLSGQLRSSSGGALSIPSQVKVFALAYSAKTDGSIDYQTQAASNVPVSADGSFSLRLFKQSAGKYFLTFYSGGSLTIPSHPGSSFWIDSSGRYSMNQSGPFQSPDSFTYISSIPAAPNLKIAALAPDGSAAEKTYVSVGEVRNDGENGTWWGGWTSAAGGLASFNLPDGAYQIYLDPQGSGMVRKQFELTVSGGIADVRTGSGEVLTPESGTFRLGLSAPNLKVRVVSPTDATKGLRNANVDIFTVNDYGDNYVTSGYVQNGSASLSVPDGSYRMRVTPWAGNFAPKDYNLEVTGTSIRVSDPATDPPTNISLTSGQFQLTVNSPNVVGVLLEPGATRVPFAAKNQKWAQIQIEKSVSGSWRYHSDAQVKGDGTFGAYISETGTYRVTARINNTPGATNTTFDQFTISNVATVTTLGDLKLNSPTFQVRVRQTGSSQNLQFASVNLWDDEGNGDWSDTGSAALAGLSITRAGVYSLRVQPPYTFSSSIASAKSYIVTATDKAGGGFNVSIANSQTPSVAISPTDGVYILQLGAPNVTGKIFDSAGGAFDGRKGGYAWIQAERYEGVNQGWQWTEYNADVFEDGSFGLSIEENGRYRLKIDPYGLPNTSTTRTSEFEVTDANRNGTAKAFGNLTLSAPTAKFRVRAAGSTTDLKYTGIEIRKDGQWFDWRNVGSNGLASFTALEAGTYEFTAIPNEKAPNSTRKTYTGTVTSSGSGFTLSIPGLSVDSSGAIVLELGTPNVTGKLVDSTGKAVANTRNSWVWIQVQKYILEEDRWEWTENSTEVRDDGTFGLNVSNPGTFRLRIETSGRQDIALTYSSSFTVTSANVSTFSQAFGNITLNSPTLSGVVKDSSNTVQRNAQVIAIDPTTGEEKWEHSTWTDNDGKWAMRLPAGNYNLIAKPGWRDSRNGASTPITGISVNSSGVATFSGSPAPSNPLTLVLGQPTWSGEVVSPTDASVKIADASICLQTVNGQRGSYSCTQSDSQGKWALSKPNGFTGFNSQSTLLIRENGVKNFAEKRLTGVAEIESVLGVYVDGQTYSNKALSPAAPNAKIRITAGGNPVPNIWVSIQRNGDWLGGAVTDKDGFAKLNIPSIASGFTIESQPNSGTAYVMTRKAYSASDVTAGTVSGTFEATLPLATPNFKGTVLEPGVGGLPVRNTWVELYNETTDEWLGGSGTNALGQYSLKLDQPLSGIHIFRVTVNPSWSGNTRLLSRQTYFVEFSSTGNITVRKGEATDGPVVPLVDGGYALELQAPTATGQVLLPDLTTPVRDSWVVPIDLGDNRNERWDKGQSSRGDGSFGLALTNGSYQVFANVPGQLSNYSRSALCDITISGGDITTPNSACVVDKKLRLALRNPNLTFKLMDDTSGVANAHVGVSVGNWYGWAQSAQDGTVSLLIDEKEIAASNPSWTTGTTLPVRLNVHAPYGNTRIVSWSCNSGESKPVCSGITGVTKGQEYRNTPLNLGEIQFQTPNTTLTIKNSTGTVIRDAQVNLYKERVGGGREYIGWANTTEDGKAVFNVEVTTGTFGVEIHPPWNARGTQARKNYSNLSYAALSSTDFRTAAPNLTVKVKQSPAPYNASRWANVWVEEVNSSTYSYVNWVNGFGSDQSGEITMFLESNKTYRLNVNPGPGSIGARTSCIVAVNGSGVVSKVTGKCPTGGTISSDAIPAIDLKLSPGNVFGRVTLGSGSGVSAVGAIVFAEAYSAGTAVAGVTRESIVDANGEYGLQLDSGYDWKIKVFYVNPSPSGTQYSSRLTSEDISSGQVPTGDSRREINFTLAAK
jgi:hypothetical protein